MHEFRQLRVWQRAREFAVEIDRVARQLPRGDHGLIAGQIRRASLSIPSNIAEGCGKSSRRETVRFLQIACGSAREVESHLLVATDLKYIEAAECERLVALVTIIEKMLFKLMRKLAEPPG